MFGDPITEVSQIGRGIMAVAAPRYRRPRNLSNKPTWALLLPASASFDSARATSAEVCDELCERA